jgi:mannose/fructose/N-acetylgalactosamine-specific phosphotransferase system component IIB
MKVAFCIPSTSNKRDWKTIGDTYLCKYLLPSLNCIFNSNIDIEIYIGYDHDDKLYSNIQLPNNISNNKKNINLKWLEFNGYKGNPCGIWNGLAKAAFKTNEYVFICGDDIILSQESNWLQVFLDKLKNNNNIGYSAGWSNNNDIPTQFLLHRKHLDIFGYIFPPEIHNWYCDNYMKELYDKGHSNWMWEYKHINAGGQPRYEPTKPDDKNISLTPDKANILQTLGHQGYVDSNILYKKLVKRDKEKIDNFIQTELQGEELLKEELLEEELQGEELLEEEIQGEELLKENNRKIRELIESKIKVKNNFHIFSINDEVSSLIYESYKLLKNDKYTIDKDNFETKIDYMKKEKGILFEGSTHFFGFSSTVLLSLLLADIIIKNNNGEHNKFIEDTYKNLNKEFIKPTLFSISSNIKNDNWTTALKGQQILIISKYSKNIMNVINDREKIYDIDLFPECEFLFIETPDISNESKIENYKNIIDKYENKINEINRYVDVVLLDAKGLNNVFIKFLNKCNKSTIVLGKQLKYYFGIYDNEFIENNKEEMKTYLNKYWVKV